MTKRFVKSGEAKKLAHEAANRGLRYSINFGSGHSESRLPQFVTDDNMAVEIEIEEPTADTGATPQATN